MSKNKEKIEEDLLNLSDKKYKEFHTKLSPEADAILGVRVPKIKEYAKKILAEDDWEETLNNIGNTYNEEKILRGIIIGQGKLETTKRISYIKSFIPQINSWSSCDITCAALKFTKNNRKEIWKLLEQYVKSKEEFTLRFVIVMYLDYFIVDEYIDEVIKIINNIYIKEYYVQMAVAWLICEIYIKYPRKAKDYLEARENRLDKFTYNKSIQKIKESYRVSQIDKANILKLKKL